MQSSINPSVLKQYLASRIKNQQQNYIHPPYNLEQQLLDAIRLGKEKKAVIILNRINRLEGATLAVKPLRSRKNALIAMCTLFTRAIINGGVYPETAYNLSDAYILEIEKLSEIERLDQLEYDMLYHFVKTVHEGRNNQNYSHPVNLAISYIYDNILAKLTLTEIASHVYVHPGYLSSRFKQEVGLSLTDFINKKRIEESKYFLLQSNSSISDIALLFRFCNQSYYTATFKKYVGVTPRDYRSREGQAPQ